MKDNTLRAPRPALQNLKLRKGEDILRGVDWHALEAHTMAAVWMDASVAEHKDLLSKASGRQRDAIKTLLFARYYGKQA